MPQAEPAARRGPPTRALVGALRRAARGSAPWGLLGQVLNAATNVATLYVASLLLDPARFGTFALAFAAVALLLGAGRGLIGATMMVELPGREDADTDALVRSALGFTLVVGLGASVVLALGSLVQGVLWWFVPWIAVALLQDTCRYVYLAANQAGRALALDAAWALVQGGVVVGVLVSGTANVGLLAVAWGAGAAAGVALFAAAHGAGPGAPGRWSRATRDVAGWFTAASVLGQVEVYLTLLVAGVLLSTTDVGGVRAVQLLVYQPAMVLLGALLTVLQPSIVLARTSATTLTAAARRARRWVMPVVATALFVAVLREPLMTVLFPRYVDFAPLVVPVALQVVFLAVATPPLTVLRGLRRGADVVTAQLFRAAVTGLAAGGGALLDGPAGLAWALTLASALAWAQVRYVSHRRITRCPLPLATEVPHDSRAA